MNKLYNDTAVQAIANAIRAKNGSSDTYTIAEMSTALNDLSYYAKPTISNVALATFEADGLPLNSLKVSVEAKQEGSGTPSPENVRPISGWSEVKVSDVDDVDNPTVTQTTTISLGQTVYGGKLDVVNGELSFNHRYILFDGSQTFINGGKDGCEFRYKTHNNSINNSVISSYLKTVSSEESWQIAGDSIAMAGQSLSEIAIRLASKVSSASELRTYFQSNPLQVVYELAEPIIINLTPTLIKSLDGINNLSVDCGEVIELEYFKEV